MSVLFNNVNNFGYKFPHYYKKILRVIFLILLFIAGIHTSTTINSTETSLMVKDTGPSCNMFVWAGAIGAATIGGVFIAHKIKAYSRCPLKMNLQKDDSNSDWVSWIKTRAASLWAWLTNEEKKVAELSKRLIDKLKQGEALADFMITRKVRYPTILGLADTRPEFFFGFPQVALRVIHGATIDQINKPSKNAYPDIEDVFEDGKYAIYPTSYSPALSLALRWGESKLALFLLSKGGDAFQEDSSWEEERCRSMELEVLGKMPGNTALHYAAAYKDPRIIKGIVSFYVKRQQILEAKVAGSADLVKLILSFTGGNRFNINVQSQRPIPYGLWGRLGEATVKDGEYERRLNFSGLTPLHIAAVHGSSETVRALLFYHPDPTLKSKYDYLYKKKSIFQTPLEALEMQLQLTEVTEDQQNKFRLLRSYTEEWNKFGAAKMSKIVVCPDHLSNSKL